MNCWDSDSPWGGGCQLDSCDSDNGGGGGDSVGKRGSQKRLWRSGRVVFWAEHNQSWLMFSNNYWSIWSFKLVLQWVSASRPLHFLMLCWGLIWKWFYALNIHQPVVERNQGDSQCGRRPAQHKHLSEELYKMVTCWKCCGIGWKLVLDREGIFSIPKAISTENQLLHLPHMRE